MKILFIGDIFGDKSIEELENNLSKIKKKHKIDFVIAQSENVSGRKGFVKKDYKRLLNAGVNAFTIGNHIWAKKGILDIINNEDIVRPYNIDNKYPGLGSRIFKIKNQTLRVSAFLGISFNELTVGWKQKYANNFFDAYDELEKEKKADFHFIDFHGETTSEKNVFSLYLDGKVDVFVGTHTHVQTNDAKILPKGTVYITDVGMTGPINSAIGADFESVYKKMRYNENSRFLVSNNKIQFNAVLITLNKNKNHKIETFNYIF